MSYTRLTSKLQGNLHYCRFRHPVRNKTVCVCLGTALEQGPNLEALERIFHDKSLWLNPPTDTPIRIRNAWMGPNNVVKLLGKQAARGSDPLRTDGPAVARLQAELDRANSEIDRLRQEIEQQAAELVHWRGRRTVKGPVLPLGQAFAQWWERWRKGQNYGHSKLVKCTVKRFVSSYGENRPLDYFIDKEDELYSWSMDQKGTSGKWKGLPWGPDSQQRAQIYVVKFLRENGIELDPKKVIKTSRDDREKNRGGIRYLQTRAEAEALSNHLPAYFRDVFQIQLALGLRPSELLTLRRECFTTDLATLNLQPFGRITLKTGPRRIPVPESTRELVARLFQRCDVLFPKRFPRGATVNGEAKVYKNRPWLSAGKFCDSYCKALTEAGKKAGINTRMDARVPRRTFASWLIQSNVGADRIAKLMGNSAKVVMSNYGDPNLGAIDLEGITVLKEREQCKRPIPLLRKKRSKVS